MKDSILLIQVINIINELRLDDYEESHTFGEIYESILRELQSAKSAGEFYTPRAVTDFMAQTINPKIGEKMTDLFVGHYVPPEKERSCRCYSSCWFPVRY